MDAQQEGAASEVLSTIFGSSTQGLSLFSNNAFRRQASAIAEGAQVELKPGKKGPPRVPGGQATSASLRSAEREPIRGADKGTGSGSKPKKKRRITEQSPSEPLSSSKELSQKENQSGSCSAVVGKKNKLGRTVEKLDNSFVADKALAKKAKGLHVSHETILKKKLKQQEDFVESEQTESKGGQQERLQEHKEIKHTIGFEVTSSEENPKHGKRVLQDASKPHKLMKRQKTSIEYGSMHSLAHGTLINQTSGPVHSSGGLKKAKAGTKRKKEDSLEARYEKKLRGLNDSVAAREESQLTSATKEEKIKSEGTNVQIKKRKRVESDENASETAISRTFDADEKLKRTIFVGNLPLAVKKKVIIKEFSMYGPIDSVRLRSVPLLDTKIPRKGAIITGQINEAIDSQHAYVVFKSPSDANAALAHNMKEFSGNHVRVDAAYAPHGAGKGKSSLHYDHRRSLFVGNIPFDVKDEELYKTFGAGKSPELDVEAVRVVRDPQTSLSKGIAYVLFKTKDGASFFLPSKRKVKLRDRILRISRVLASQSMQKQPSPSKRVRKPEEMENSQRKRAKLSTSYEGVKSRKDPSKVRHKGTRSSGQQHVSGLVKGRPKGPANIAGTKRKRVEKKQRGISRSKKIRRT